MKETKEEALRYNEGKLRYDLIHPVGLEGLVKVLTTGAVKYKPKNWEAGMRWSKVIASLKRHLSAIEKGEDYDSETGLLHADHIQCNAHFLSTYYKIAPEYDDRSLWYKTPFKKLFIDIDGVIAGFEEAFNEKFGFTDDPHDWKDHRYVKRMKELMDDNDFWLNIKPLVNPAEIDYPIAGYCTARSIPTETIEKWLELHMFPFAPILRVEYNESKINILKEAGCEVFIDDSIYNFVELNSNGILCYLATRPHNTKYNVGHLRVENLLDLINNKLK